MRWTLLAFLVLSAAAQAANPFGIFYGNSLENLDDYAHPGAIVVAGNCNRYNPRFQDARAKGAELLAYFDAIDIYDALPCKLNADFYMGGRERVPLWPYPAFGVRMGYKNSRLTDIRVGSTWPDHIVDYVAQLMREGKVDGVFMDNLGAKLWGNIAKWSGWPDDERDAWTAGNVDLVRRLDEKRRQINPKFLIVTNNFWDRGDKQGLEGERYVDGVVLEHSKVDDWHQRYVGRPFSNLGHRRVLVIARNGEDALIWAKTPGVTHISDQEKYEHPNKPVVPFDAAPR